MTPIEEKIYQDALKKKIHLRNTENKKNIAIGNCSIKISKD